MPSLTFARRQFYRAGGPWLRRGVFEALGSQRYSKPALFGMEDVIARHLPDRGGVFVEAGAHDGFTQSNTYWLERHRGWSGVLVEAVPALAARCSRRRPRSLVLNCALVAEATPGATMTVQYGDLMSTVAGARGSSAADAHHAALGTAVGGGRPYRVEVPARTLTQVLDEADVGRPDLLVLDIEGLELAALHGLDLERHAPRFMLIEMLELERQLPAFEEFLGDRYETVERASDFDVLFAHM
jgi:FkbM family methyltransferase